MASNFPVCFCLVVNAEGGYSDNPLDKGGPTMWGITMATLAAHRGHPVTAADVKNMPLQEVEDIYQQAYWNAAGCEQLPYGADYALFDAAVNSGPAQAVKWLQRAVGVTADGKIGPATIRAALTFKPEEIALKVCQQRLSMVLNLNSPTEEEFEKGWGSRILKVLQIATQMVDHHNAGA